MTAGNSDSDLALRSSFVVRVMFLAFIGFAIAVILITNLYLTDRFTAATRSRAELRLALYSSSIVSELQRNSVVPLLLSRDPILIKSLYSADFAATTQRLISYKEEIRAANLLLLDADGVAVAATDRTVLAGNHGAEPYFIEALKSNETIFTTRKLETGATRFAYSRRIEHEKEGIGVIAVEVDLGALERNWTGTSEAVLVTDAGGTIILATEPKWRNLTVEAALATRPAPSAIERAIQVTGDWGLVSPDTYLKSADLLRLDGSIPFQGWRLTYFTSYTSVRDRVNGFLALEVMGFAILTSIAFYLLSRRARYQTLLSRRESAELRRLNDQLSREIAERERAEENLKVAEQTIAQSSKLAALGEMSAAVSHELNQPLAAMKTYLAGARLLLQRKRADEALSSFQRIDGLIDRMGAITRQLKSYARKGGDDLVPVDLREAITQSLAMMAPQLNQRKIAITRNLPGEPVMVLGDAVRLEQVLINLFRNALDAVKGRDDGTLDILLAQGAGNAVLTVRDNGPGIEDHKNLFEPFYTTKKPGEGVGLGLAISSGIINDLGGRLTAHNAQPSGAIFEIQLPMAGATREAAE